MQLCEEKCAELLSHNFQQVVFVVQGGEKARSQSLAENQETIFILKPVTTGLLSKVTSNLFV